MMKRMYASRRQYDNKTTIEDTIPPMIARTLEVPIQYARIRKLQLPLPAVEQEIHIKDTEAEVT